MTTAPRRQRGAALLVAMITVALVATLAATALWRSWRNVEVESAERTRVQADWILVGALDWARLILAGDLREDQQKGQLVDTLTEPWSVPLAEARLSSFLAEGGRSAATDRDAFLSGQIQDLQGRLNVMNLTIGTPQNQAAALQRFERLYQALGLPANAPRQLQQSLLRAKDPGASDGPLPPTRFDQLTWLGIPPATLARLQPYLTLLPLSGQQPTPVNLNTAPAEVIYAALPTLNLNDARQLVAARTQTPWLSVASALTAVHHEGGDASWASVNTQFFEISARLRLDDRAVDERAIVERTGGVRGRSVLTLSRERVVVALPQPGAAPSATVGNATTPEPHS